VIVGVIEVIGISVFCVKNDRNHITAIWF